MQANPSNRPTSPRLDTAPACRRRLLIVDDDVGTATVLAMTMSEYGHSVEVAYNGTDALAAAERFRPDVVFLDLVMPGMSGFEVVRALRALPGLSNVLIAALTGWNDQVTRMAVVEAGFDRHLVKPPYLAEIFDVLACAAQGGGAVTR
ncbi:response regulator [Massilia sp. BKSP1R2A-1]|uniref:response regulator n=1 Tax=Massilia sp. BKSP1R2A-1 TaxID=3422595 RepID=UPI003D3441B5